MVKDYKRLSKEGEIEALIFMSVWAFDEIPKEDYDFVAALFFKILIERIYNFSPNLSEDYLLDFINSRYLFFSNELQKLDESENALPLGIYSVFYEKPFITKPQTKPVDPFELMQFYETLKNIMYFMKLHMEAFGQKMFRSLK